MVNPERGFDPNAHRMLEGENAWVKKEVPEFDSVTIEEKQEYNNLVDKVAESKGLASKQEAYDAILAIEEKYDQKLGYRPISEDPFVQSFNDNTRTLQLYELGTANTEEAEVAQQFQDRIKTLTESASNETGKDTEETRKSLFMAVRKLMARNWEEVETFLASGIVVAGFGESREVGMTDEQVHGLLISTFTAETLKNAKIGRISKAKELLIYPPNNDRNMENTLNKLVKDGVLISDRGLYMAKTPDDYLKAERALEGVGEGDQLQHTFKVRAATEIDKLNKIEIKGFALEDPRNHEYLDEAVFGQDIMRAYILGTIVHEVAHCIYFTLPSETINGYDEAFQKDGGGKRFVTSYVETHATAYKSNASAILAEDFAEAVRVYVTNPQYLEANFSGRYQFIQENFKYIKTGYIREFLSTPQQGGS